MIGMEELEAYDTNRCAEHLVQLRLPSTISCRSWAIADSGTPPIELDWIADFTMQVVSHGHGTNFGCFTVMGRMPFPHHSHGPMETASP